MTSAKHQPIVAPGLPKPAGPYSPGMQLDRLLFISGQAARDPATGVQAEGIEAQTEQVLRNLERILVAGGSSLQHVLRCGVFLVDMQEFPRMNAVYERVFAGHRPARTTVQVSALPDVGLRVEIDCIAYVP
ncbi:RidA family protein [Corallococcus exercitus]|uniref:RidA family protein n=1 Tax=Corallococcus exercitus TaxID=2316736 RepID=UPI000EA143CC|nr:RidA family protein [Corallococcus exercitus]RKG81463.1 RidA family protein [Corallococcus exercitus]